MKAWLNKPLFIEAIRHLSQSEVSQLEKLKVLGVDYAQGYMTGKPELLFDPSLNP